MHFVGYTLWDSATGEMHYHVPVEFDNKVDQLIEKPLSKKFVRNFDESHTRLLGFRTSKRCHESRTIRTVMPIFYSVDEKMC